MLALSVIGILVFRFACCCVDLYCELDVWFLVKWTTVQKCGHATSVFSVIRWVVLCDFVLSFVACVTTLTLMNSSVSWRAKILYILFEIFNFCGKLSA